MLRRMLGLIGLVAAMGVPAAPAAAAEPVVDLADLLADPGAYAAPEVPLIRVRGELVGDFGRRDGVVWTQVNDDPYATAPLLAGGDLAGGNLGVGVRIPEVLWQDVGSAGGYRHRGAIVEVVGAWRHHDPDRSGESYLDVTGFALVEGEQPLDEDIPWTILGIGAILMVAAGAITLRGRGLRPRGRDSGP